MHRRRRTLQAEDQINLTSLLDLTFVLLIAFMIVAPTMRPQIDVQVPSNVPNTTAGANDENSTIITIAKKKEGQTLDRIYVTRKGRGDTRITDMDQLVELLTDIRKRDRSGKPRVVIEVGRKVPSETFIQVIGACQKAGIEKVDIPTEPPGATPSR